MKATLIARRFVRIKALQNLYAYTIQVEAQKKIAINQLKTEFVVDYFVHLPEQQKELAAEEVLAIELFAQAITSATPHLAYGDNKKIEAAIGRAFTHYMDGLSQGKAILYNGWMQSKRYTYKNCLHILLLLLTWHKMARQSVAHLQEDGDGLQMQLAHNSILEALATDSQWLRVINHKLGVDASCDNIEEQAKAWYAQVIPSAAPLVCTHETKRTQDSTFLEQLVGCIIFKHPPVQAFLQMEDLAWELHKEIVKKILSTLFNIIGMNDFAAFTLSWKDIETKWERESIFYNRLLQLTLQYSQQYDAMIGAKAEKWESKRVMLIDKLIMKLALAELLEMEEIPLKVSINEYLEIAKRYGTAKSVPFINGILENIALQKQPSGDMLKSYIKYEL